MSDVWWNAAEPGWGIALHQQRDTVFATIYVYSGQRAPEWYSGTLEFQGLTAQSREVNFAGELYRTDGPWFGATPFDATGVARRKVGTMQLHAPTMTSATVTYTIDGVQVTKDIERMTFRTDDYAGEYAGAFSVATTHCMNPGDDGASVRYAAMQIVQSAAALTITVATDRNTCTYTGPYVQHGRLGSAFADFSCSSGEVGTLVFEEMNVQRFGVTGRLFGADSRGCHIEGRFAAVRP